MATHPTNVLKREVQLLLTAVMFYTRLPVPKCLPFSQDRLNLSRKYFPAIGTIIGCISGLCYFVSVPVLGVSLAVLLSMCVSILATGAFHEDGFADSCDGLGGGWEKDSVLTIMKDSRIGTYGTVGLISILAVKAIALIEIAKLVPVSLFLLVYIAAHTWSRQLSSSAIEFFNYVQDIDQSKVKPITDRHLPFTAQVLSFLTSALILISLIVIELQFLYAVLVAAFVAIYFLRYSNKRIGGYTGDILGATQQLAEVSFYIAALAVLTTSINGS